MKQKKARVSGKQTKTNDKGKGKHRSPIPTPTPNIKRQPISSPGSNSDPSRSPSPAPANKASVKRQRLHTATTPATAQPSARGAKGNRLTGPELVLLFEVCRPKARDFDGLIPRRTGKRLHDNWT